MVNKMQGKEPKLLCRNSAGKKDGMWTMSWISFVIWAFHAVLLGIFGGSSVAFQVGEASVNLVLPQSFEWLSLTALLPLWAGYIIRRNNLFAKKAKE